MRGWEGLKILIYSRGSQVVKVEKPIIMKIRGQSTLLTARRASSSRSGVPLDQFENGGLRPETNPRIGFVRIPPDAAFLVRCCRAA